MIGHQLTRGTCLELTPGDRIETAESQEIVERAVGGESGLLFDVAGIVSGRVCVALVHQEAQVLAAVRRCSHALKPGSSLESRRRWLRTTCRNRDQSAQPGGSPDTSAQHG